MKRYDMQAGDGPSVYPIEEPEGVWVRFEDVAALLAALDATDMECALARAKILTDGVAALTFERDEAMRSVSAIVAAADEGPESWMASYEAMQRTRVH